MQSIKLRLDDLNKVCKYLEENCKGSAVFLSEMLNSSGIKIDATTTREVKVQILVYSDDNYMLPKITKTEEL